MNSSLKNVGRWPKEDTREVFFMLGWKRAEPELTSELHGNQDVGGEEGKPALPRRETQ